MAKATKEVISATRLAGGKRLAALHQERVHRRVDTVDLRPQITERGHSPRALLRFFRFSHGCRPSNAP